MDEGPIWARMPRVARPFQPGGTDPDSARIVYGVGDVHGMDHLLDTLLAMIETDARMAGMAATVVFLGDVVNRGARSRQVLDRLRTGPSRPGDEWIVLRGNHEQAMLDALTGDSEALFDRWLRIGGMETLESYGGTHKHARPDRARDLIGPDPVRFLASLPLTYISGQHLFVHAGVEPGVPLHRQDPAKLMTIRGRFLRKHHGLPYTVVHGHTPTAGRPRFGPGRIGVDTGAYVTGILTAVAVGADPESPRFLRAVEPSRSAKRRLLVDA